MNYPDFSTIRKRRRRERVWVAVILALLLIFGFFEGWFFQFQSDLPLVGNILLFALINLNVLLLLLLFYVLMRHIVKLIFERRRNILGHRLRTRLAIAFACLALIPTLPLFGLATQFISFSLEYWFSSQVERSLEESMLFGKQYLEEETRKLLADGDSLSVELIGVGGTAEDLARTQPDRLPDGLLERYRLSGLFVASAGGKVFWQRWDEDGPTFDAAALKAVMEEALQRELKSQLVPLEKGSEALIALREVPIATPLSDPPRLFIGLVRKLPAGVSERLNAVTSGYENYLQLKLLQEPLKTSHLITFSIITLLVIFAAIWFGLFLAKSITVPIQGLLQAMERVAQGDLNVQLDWDREDELGMLVKSFNRMVHDLRLSREQLASAYEALKAGNEELEARRRYIEIILRNIGAGVVSVDADGVVRTINKSAEAMFGFRAEEVSGRSYTDLLQPDHLEIVKAFMSASSVGRQANVEKQFQVMVGNRPLVLLIKATLLRDESGRYLGVVVVFDDLTELEKAHRMAAWREVARRIAHEIKNPLTPIQLSAQRLRRRYPELLEAKEGILDECTRTIIDQVEQMKRLVNEFSTFARLPSANPAPCHLGDLVRECLGLYRHTYGRISFDVSMAPDFPVLRLDRDQFRQVMINLLENAVQAMDGSDGRVEVRLTYDPILRIARLECADTGQGLRPEDKLRIFEPYYSTKEKGTGLGLAIVSNIVADHNGYIRVRDNQPKGTVIVIELPAV
ncbi:sensor histidine kinase [Desulfoglaeba alkanexedens]|uniref:histidine kinase n=1 Tax=Desulfoglaeba alkanexedens ALDC TaxID=980445 RepID=A0A4P8L963_9BACT|nr:ATP-binding protein [Desulfoglaeba alkanexedens]QCQ23192.1 HAMP domain-containing protein [Desulfoglaeba alkanexedens ALDC]